MKQLPNTRYLVATEITECAQSDLVILVDSEKYLQRNANAWREVINKFGLEINILKTKVMVVAMHEKYIKIQIDDTKIYAVVDEYKIRMRKM